MFLLPQNDWKFFFDLEKNKKYFIDLEDKLNSLYNSKVIYPAKENIFKTFFLTDFSKLKVIIIGQDPYHNGEANGCSFACLNKITKSLSNIKKELVFENNNDDFELDISLSKWSEQGVLMINTLMTVEKSLPLSHKNFGWEKFISNLFDYLQNKKENIAILILGKFMKPEELNINNKNWLILQTSHPSFFSFNKGFYKSNVFLKINSYLNNNHQDTINWWAQLKWKICLFLNEIIFLNIKK